jgi:hypothetical protein
MWELRGTRGRFSRERRVMLKGSTRKKWREQFVCHKWLNINEDMPYKKDTNSTNLVQLKNIGQNLFRTGCKWGKKFTAAQTTLEDTKEGKHKM